MAFGDCTSRQGRPAFFQSRLLRRAAVALLIAGSLALAPTTRVARAQAERGQMIDDLVRQLVEAELKRLQEEKAVGGGVSATAAPAAAISDSDLRRVRDALKGFSDESSALTDLTQQNIDRIAGLRAIMPDVLKIRARSVVLFQKSQQINDRAVLSADFQPLDRDWRVLAVRLGQVTGLTSSMKQRIDAINAHDKNLGTLLGIAAQLDRLELTRQSAALTADLHNLLEDIEIELEPSRERDQLLVSGRQLQQQAWQVTNAVADDSEYDTVVRHYKRFQTLWFPLAAQLRPLNNTYLERSVRRIETVDAKMHELLWMPQQMNRQQLLQLTKVLKNDVDEFFSRTPLKLLISMERSDEILITSDEFYGTCENFADCVQRGENEQELMAAFGYVDRAWGTFNNLFKGLKSTAALQVLSGIERSMTALRGAMNVQDSFDRREAVEIAAQIDTLAYHLEVEAEIALARSTDPLASTVRQEVKSFHAAAHALHERFETNADLRQLRDECNVLYQRWQRVDSYVNRLNATDRNRLSASTAKVTPFIVDLRTRLSL